MSLMEAGNADKVGVRPGRDEEIAQASGLAIGLSAMSEEDIEARIAKLRGEAEQITNVIDFHDGRPSRPNDPGIHYGITASGQLVDPLSIRRVAS